MILGLFSEYTYYPGPSPSISSSLGTPSCIIIKIKNAIPAKNPTKLIVGVIASRIKTVDQLTNTDKAIRKAITIQDASHLSIAPGNSIINFNMPRYKTQQGQRLVFT